MNADLFRPKGERPARKPHDHYPSPPWVIEAALRFVEGLPYHILDPGAGEGQWGAVARRMWSKARIAGWEIRREVEKPSVYDDWWVGDYCGHWASVERHYDLICGNPPYGQANEFIKRSFELLLPQGELVFLLRLPFLCGQARARGLYREHPPKDIACCSRRVSFYGNGKTSSDDYAVFHWVKGWHGAPRVHWIGVD